MSDAVVNQNLPFKGNSRLTIGQEVNKEIMLLQDTTNFPEQQRVPGSCLIATVPVPMIGKKVDVEALSKFEDLAAALKVQVVIDHPSGGRGVPLHRDVPHIWIFVGDFEASEELTREVVSRLREPHSVTVDHTGQPARLVGPQASGFFLRCTYTEGSHEYVLTGPDKPITLETVASYIPHGQTQHPTPVVHFRLNSDGLEASGLSLCAQHLLLGLARMGRITDTMFVYDKRIIGLQRARAREAHASTEHAEHSLWYHRLARFLNLKKRVKLKPPLKGEHLYAHTGSATPVVEAHVMTAANVVSIPLSEARVIK